MNELDSATGNSNGTDAATVGTQLRRAREAQQLSPQDVAQRLNLDTRKVIALEADDFGALPAGLYVRGYIRSVANLLGLEAESLIASYEKLRDDSEPELAAFASRPPLQSTSSSSWVKAVTILLVLSLIVLVGLWLRSSYFSGVAEPEDLQELRTESGSPAITVSPAPQSERLQPNLSEPEPDVPGVTTVVDELIVETAETPEQASVESLLDNVLSADESAAQDIPSAIETDLIDETAEPIVLELTEEAWIEITDASGERLYYDLGKPQQTIEVSGMPPFSLLIGNSPAVNLLYGDEPVDLTDHSRSGVARLTLGDEPSVE